MRCYDDGYYWVTEDLNESGYLCDYRSASLSLGSSSDGNLGYAGGYLWLTTEGVINRISLDGN